MSQVITNAFEQYWQSSLAAEQPVVLDEFILADIPNLDITAPIDPDTVLPPESQIVHRQSVDQRGRINNNAVAYTIVMDTTVGDFSFNAMYLRNKQNGVIGMIVYKGRETKLKTDQTTGQTGNSLVKSMLMGYDQAAEATLTNVDAGTWQIDYAARLRGMDEDIRQLQADLYGHHTFVGDGFKVVEKDGAYQVSQGVAIIGGLRVELKAPEVIHPGTKPIGVWVDVHRAGSLLSEHQNHFTIITSVADLTDHVDSNDYQHYVAKLGTILADSTIEDGRVQGSSGGIDSSLIRDPVDGTVAYALEMGRVRDLEAIRRTYAKAGYRVNGEFVNGEKVESAYDVLIDMETGKGYSHNTYPYTVKLGETPESEGWTDRSGYLEILVRSLDELNRLPTPLDNQRVYLSSLYEGKASGSGRFFYDADSTQSEFKGVVIKPPMVSTGRWRRDATEDLSLYHFGAYGDGSHDDTQSALDWLRWQLESGKTKPELGAGNFLITSQLPFFNRGTVFGSGYDTNLVIGLNDDDILFSVPNGAYGYSWAMKDVRFTVASGGSTRCRLFDVNGSLRGARIQDISAWEFSRPLRFANNIWGNLVLDGVNLYRISNPIEQGDIAIEYAGNTMMGQNIEIVGAFDKLIKFKGSVFKLDGLNPSGSSGASVAGSGILIEEASSGYIRSGWIELVDKNISNGEAEAVMVRNSKNITVENMHIPTGSIWFDGGSRNAVKNIAYFQTNAGVRAINNAQVDVSLSGLGKYNLSTSDAKRTYAKPSLVDGNNTGKGLLPNPIDPITMTGNVAKTNSGFVALTADKNNFNSGTQSTKVTTTSAYHGVDISASVVPGKIYTVCAAVKVSSGIVVMSQGENTSGKTDSVIYVGRSMGASDSEWLLLSFPASSSTTTLTVRIRNEVAGEFLLDAVDVYAGASTFNPSNIG